jgi:hypothetical protein
LHRSSELYLDFLNPRLYLNPGFFLPPRPFTPDSTWEKKQRLTGFFQGFLGGFPGFYVIFGFFGFQQISIFVSYFEYVVGHNFTYVYVERKKENGNLRLRYSGGGPP